jgi:hypothetical protein
MSAYDDDPFGGAMTCVFDSFHRVACTDDP